MCNKKECLDPTCDSRHHDCPAYYQLNWIDLNFSSSSFYKDVHFWIYKILGGTYRLDVYSRFGGFICFRLYSTIEEAKLEAEKLAIQYGISY